MSIIKFQDAHTGGGVRVLDGAPRKPTAADIRYDALEREVDRLTSLLAEKDAEIEKCAAAIDDAFKAGHDDGRAKALDEAAADRDSLAASLEAAVDCLRWNGSPSFWPWRAWRKFSAPQAPSPT